jgi:penicillin-binding protein 2
MRSTQRIHIYLLFVYFVFSFLVFSLFKIQVLNGYTYREKSENNRIRLIPIKSTRGRILDRNAVVLADNIPSFNLNLIPHDFSQEKLSDLAAVINISIDSLKKKISEISQPAFVPVKIKEDLSEKEIHILEERSNDFSGTFITVTGKRFYPLAEIASQIVGYIGKISPKEYKIKKNYGYLIDDYVGRTGIESIFDDILHGVHGGKQIEVNARGQEKRVLALQHPQTGTDIQLTIDSYLQSAIHKSLNDEKASVCLMNIHSGEILALVSTPGYDPNAFVTPSRSNERIGLLQDKSLPFLNRAISSPYPPGSVFKLVTALAALETGKITRKTTLTCTGAYQITPHSRVFHCWAQHGHGEVSLEKALQQSCNVYFYKIGQMIGADAIAAFSRKIGIDRDFSLELPNVKHGTLPSTSWKKERLKEDWYQGETLNYAIGQGYLTVTPLQVLRIVSLIASDGKIIEPTIIKGVKHVQEQVRISPEHLRAVKQGMLQAVDTRYGTAHVAKVDFFKVAGKTGTAQTTGDSHSWFAGFFPYNNPQVALVVIIEHGGSGGGKAATVANHVASLWHERIEVKNEL